MAKITKKSCILLIIILLISGYFIFSANNSSAVYDEPATTSSSCTESDEAKDYYTKGTTQDSEQSQQDYCLNDNYLVEYYCYNNELKSKEHWCEYGCNAGVCNQTSTCSDSDNGKDYHTQGTLENLGQTHTDYCLSDKTLVEYYCYASQTKSKEHWCEYGCNTGVCNQTSTCSDSDNGKDYHTQGTLNNLDYTHTDYCLDDQTLVEYYCHSSQTKNKQYACSNGCSQGACVTQGNNAGQKPDLVPTKIEINNLTNPEDDEIRKGDKLEITIQIQNSGDADARKFFYTLAWQDSPSVFNPQVKNFISQLKAGKTYTYKKVATWIYNVEAERTINLTLTVDSFDYIEESDETNNTLTQEITLQSISSPVKPGTGDNSCKIIRRNPTRDKYWEQLGLNTSAHPEIIKYRIQWFNGSWSDWYKTGINDIDWKDNCGDQYYLGGSNWNPDRPAECSRRVWSYFTDHVHEYYQCADDDSDDDQNEVEEDSTDKVRAITGIAKRVVGKLLLATENRGRVYYVNPDNHKRYEVTFGNLMSLFKRLALGITNQDLDTIPIHPDSVSDDVDSDDDGYSDKVEVTYGYNPFLPGDPANRGSDKMKFRRQTYERLKGRILIQAEDRGQIWYVDDNGKRWQITWDNALNVFRSLALGITNQDLEQIEEEN